MDRLKHELMDHLETKIATLPGVVMPTEHAIALGFYIRKIRMPAGAILTTKTHGKRHPFMVMEGKVLIRSVDSSEGEGQIIRAPHVGITEPGTRRLIYVEEECVWVTFHSLSEMDLGDVVGKIEEGIMVPRTNPDAPYANSLNQFPKEALT